MNNIINDIFSKYQVRKTRKQKTDFIEFTISKAEELGYSAKIEKGALGARNIVVGSAENAKVIYTAHYDTCARLPFPNFLTPKNFFVYLLYSLAIVFCFFVVTFVLGFGAGIICAAFNVSPSFSSLIAEIIYICLFLLVFFGPANRHTANDNTSGVTVLFGIMKALSKEQKNNVAFVFFDHEESGLIGSSSFASKHKNIKKNTLLLNFDCVSDGKDILILTKKAAKPYSAALSEAFSGNGNITAEVTSKAFYPSDQAQFKKGVGIAAFKKTKGGMLYIDKIHTNKDTVFERENIDFIINGAVKLVNGL